MDEAKIFEQITWISGCPPIVHAFHSTTLESGSPHRFDLKGHGMKGWDLNFEELSEGFRNMLEKSGSMRTPVCTCPF